MVEREPTTDLHVIHVIPDMKAYRDILLCYQEAAKRLPWMTVLASSQWHARRNELSYDPKNLVVAWGYGRAAELPPGRKAKVAIRYSEMIADFDVLDRLENDTVRANFQSFLRHARQVDAVFVNTPAGKAKVEELAPGLNIHVAPSGYEPVLGIPDWKTEKKHKIVYYGARMKRRRGLLPKLLAAGLPIIDITGKYGQERKRLLDESIAVLHIQELPGSKSFSAFRIWQTIASSAMLICEPADTWPSVDDVHHLGIPNLDDDLDKAVSMMAEMVDNPRKCLKIAKTACQELSGYTVDVVMNRFMLPAMEIAHR